MLVESMPKFSVEMALTCMVQWQVGNNMVLDFPAIFSSVLRSWIWEQCCNHSSVSIWGLGPNVMYTLQKWYSYGNNIFFVVSVA